MMLEFLGEDETASKVRDAVAKSEDAEGTTSEIGDTIAERV
jgi:isocitrate/isopropylmalate dehydrogenase